VTFCPIVYSQIDVVVVYPEDVGHPADPFYSPERRVVIEQLERELESLLALTSYPEFTTTQDDGFSVVIRDPTTQGLYQRSAFTNPANTVTIQLGSYNDTSNTGAASTNFCIPMSGSAEKIEEYSTMGTAPPPTAGFDTWEVPVRQSLCSISFNSNVEYTHLSKMESTPAATLAGAIFPFEDIMRHEMFHGVFGLASLSPAFQSMLISVPQLGTVFQGPLTLTNFPEGIPLDPEGVHVEQEWMSWSPVTGGPQRSMMAPSAGSHDGLIGHEFELTADCITMLVDMGFDIPLWHYPIDPDAPQQGNSDQGEEENNDEEGDFEIPDEPESGESNIPDNNNTSSNNPSSGGNNYPIDNSDLDPLIDSQPTGLTYGTSGVGLPSPGGFGIWIDVELFDPDDLDNNGIPDKWEGASQLTGE